MLFYFAKRVRSWCNVETATPISRSNSNFERHFVFKIATAEKPASKIKEIAKGIKTRRAAFEIVGYYARASIQNFVQNRSILDFRVLL